MGLDISPSWEGGQEDQEEFDGNRNNKDTINTFKRKAENFVEVDTKTKVRPRDFEDEQLNNFTDKLTSKIYPESGRIESETKKSIFIPNFPSKSIEKP